MFSNEFAELYLYDLNCFMRGDENLELVEYS